MTEPGSAYVVFNDIPLESMERNLPKYELAVPALVARFPRLLLMPYVRLLRWRGLI